MSIANVYSSLITLEQNLVRYQRLVSGLHAFSNGPIAETETYRCLQIVSRNLVSNLSAQYDTMVLFLQSGRTKEALEKELEPLINQYDAHRRLWLMFAEHIPIQRCPHTPAQ